ncbi:BQ5605_C001g00669 [Microbotryum silenes-dioicae]|uniref:BQ5605_C001g00669 protein n=1 Tax=Microbotryum silenes-dioicae TaxID=796604 RepID=A0A2X0M7C4_9BASI|nr:BQ5605_C001g00669 [Microbotryum silenes-dioicae]
MKRVKSLSYSSHFSPFHRQDAKPAPPPLPTTPSLPPQPPLKVSSSLLDLRSLSKRPGNLLRRFKSRDDELFGCAGEMPDLDDAPTAARDSADGQGLAIDELPSPPPRFWQGTSHSPTTSTSSSLDPLSPPPYCPPPRVTSLQSRESLRALERQREEEAAANACITYIAAHASLPSLSRPLPGPGPLSLDMNAVASYQRYRASSCASSAFTSRSQTSSRPSTNDSLPSYRSTAGSVASDSPSSERITFAAGSPPGPTCAARTSVSTRQPGGSISAIAPQAFTATLSSEAITRPSHYDFI